MFPFFTLLRTKPSFAVIKRIERNKDELKQYNPNVFNSIGPQLTAQSDNDSDNSVALGFPTDTGNMRFPPIKPEFQSGMILVGSDLKLVKAIHNDRDLIEKAGLHIDPTDDLRIIHNSDGKIVGAIAFGTKHVNQIKKIRYIDIDPDSQNFNKCLCHMIRNTDHSSNPLRFYNVDDIEIDRDDIDPKYIL